MHRLCRPSPAARTPELLQRAPKLALALALPLAVTFALATASPLAQARRDGDHDRARAAVQAGEALPLPAVLKQLERSHPGQVLEVELEREDGRWRYEVKLLQADGQLLKLVLDARTGAVLSERRRGEGERRGRERP